MIRYGRVGYVRLEDRLEEYGKEEEVSLGSVRLGKSRGKKGRVR